MPNPFAGAAGRADGLPPQVRLLQSPASAALTRGVGRPSCEVPSASVAARPARAAKPLQGGPACPT
ncbi:hypothetical protein VQ03_20645 [Methylobacterium tarhaniae]|uniref:Uncharacterized protein n=1 Tax=Methylobacterium tarhaniae TaxID=1187852 RepID=A0A0J6SSY3_9HYPH|nr:hypothetical protein VQ03_20645 [Methylobacterium tarhaniae]